MDRAEAIKRLESIQSKAWTGAAVIVHDDFKALYMAISALREREEVARDSHDVATPCKWVSIKQRLPEREGNYLIASQITGYVGIRHFYRTCPEAFTWQSACTHWMPLPEPPKEGACNG